jgi:DHA1 family bicyclomycin/chloramphenicol resistance-like MFS transporter
MQNRSLLLLLMAMSAIGPVSLNIVVPAIPGLVSKLATDTETIQLTISLYLFGLAVSQLLIGPLSDRFGRRPVVIGGLALTALASLAAIAASTVGNLIVARIVQSLGASTGLVVGRAIIRDLFERERAASVIGLVATVMVAAPMVAPLIGGILDTAFGWEAIFVFVAVASLSVVLWAAARLPETRIRHSDPQEQVKFLSELGKLATSPSFAGYVLAGALGSAPFFTFLGGAPHVVVTIMGRTSAEYGVWFAIAALGYMAGNFIASRLSVRHGVDIMIWWGIAIEIVGALESLVLAIVVPDGGPGIVFLPQLVISLGNGMLLPNAIAGAVSVRPRAAGSASGITGFTQMAIGAAAAQGIGHALAGAATPLPMALAMLGFAVIAALAFGLLIRRGQVDL